MAEPITDPSGCRHCGVPERSHFQRWDEEAAGWHGWVQPTQEQIKARMLARRNHKQEGTTMPTPMTPETVPAELLDEACDQFFGTPADPGDDRRAMARALATVLPLHDRRVRERVAVEIEETIDADAPGDFEAGLERAARVARQERGA